MGVAAPVIVAEMADWIRAGGGNSGICGDPNHTYGFHLGASDVPATDYSRWRDPNGSDGPYVNWSYCCAGDFRHGGNEALRTMQRNVLARLMRGELPMICEFIGQPWADQPVYYWARWNGNSTLQRYNGAGHDLWSHISWYRSRVDQRAFLWVAPPTPPVQSGGDDMSYRVRSGAADGSIYVVPGWQAPSGLIASYGLDGPTNEKLAWLPLYQLSPGLTVQASGLYDIGLGAWPAPPPVPPATPVTIDDEDAALIASKVVEQAGKPLTSAQTQTAVTTALASTAGQTALVAAANKAEDS